MLLVVLLPSFSPVYLYISFFSVQVASIIANRQKLPPEDMVALQVALVNLALKCYPHKVEYIDKVMLTSVEVL